MKFQAVRQRALYNYIFNQKYILSGYRGSIAHNLHIPREADDVFGVDDIDTFSVYCFPVEYYFALEGYYHSKEVEEKKIEEHDSVDYEIRKAIHLLAGCNPNVIGWLWTKHEHLTKVSEGGKLLLENRQIFLAKKRIRDAFSGYAYGQLSKLTEGAYKGYMGEKRKKVVEKYGYDTKNACTLIRLLRQGTELLLTGELQTYREKDREELLNIKKGGLTLNELQKLADQEFEKVDAAFKKSKLPDENSRHKISELLVEIIKLENQ